MPERVAQPHFGSEKVPFQVEYTPERSGIVALPSGSLTFDSINEPFQVERSRLGSENEPMQLARGNLQSKNEPFQLAGGSLWN
jgi:hypothetical protein